MLFHYAAPAALLRPRCRWPSAPPGTVDLNALKVLSCMSCGSVSDPAGTGTPALARLLGTREFPLAGVVQHDLPAFGPLAPHQGKDPVVLVGLAALVPRQMKLPG